ncbi:hypothetical protein NLJ89_g133 [Agrocybe chaxingu]|uniref:Ribonuclease H n=1 Tax=Agrocybe chaxingu TaxID=84603 RepID=A0A9W8N2F2_9AGAR|nr:hypothetical protein NLJ89_g133 [Agrocybe chaxingu]
MSSSRTAKGGFYAVHKGRIPGVYTTWTECEAQIKGFPDAKYKKFPNQNLAQDFVAGIESTAPAGPSTSTSEDGKGKKRIFSEVEGEFGWSVVYSDGACKGNGKIGSIAGVGVWWGPNDARNIAERCPGDQTNNRAELIVRLLIEAILPAFSPFQYSQYSINCFQRWVKKWAENGWKTASGEPVKNAGIIQCIAKHFEIRAKSGQKLSLQYVKGHSGDVGNDGADAMANQGACLPFVPERNWEALHTELDQILSKTGLANEANVASVGIQGPEGVVEVIELPTKVRKVATVPDAKALSSQLISKVEHKNGATVACAPTSALKPVPSGKQPPTTPLKPSAQASPQQLPDRNSVPYNWPKSQLKVLCAVPPLVPIRIEEVNVNDYADCLLDDADLADELSD